MEQFGDALKDFQLESNIQSKLSFEYGLRVSKKIESTVRGGGNTGYYFIRNARFRKNRNWAAGKIDVYSMFADRMEMNGKQNYVNLKWSCLHVVNTIISRLVGRWMTQNEKCFVTAIDIPSVRKKEEQANDAEFAMDNKQMIEQLQASSGTPIIKQDQYIPEDKDDLENWKSQFNRLPEEIGYELGTNNIFTANGFYDVIKEKLLHDSAEVGLVGTYVYMDRDGEIHTEYVKSENIIASYSEYQDFRDTSWRGQIKSLKISKLREKYGIANGGKLTEEDIFTKYACKAKEWQLQDKITWQYQWNDTYFRPYDEWNIDVMDFELRSVDRDTYSMKVSNMGTLIIEKSPDRIQPKAEVVKKDKWNIYHGVYAMESDSMLEWGLKENMIRPQDPKELGDAEFSYSFYMYQNNDMRNLAIPEKIEEPIEQMILTRLKMQQLVAKMRPPGAAINYDAMQEIDLGLGEDGQNKPLNVKKNYDQTGDIYYRGRDAEGNPIPVPISELTNSGFLPQMQALIQKYGFDYQVLKDELGEDPNLMQQALQPRVTTGNIQTSIEQANNATGYMYVAYLRVMEDTAKKVSCLLNTSVSFGAKKYRDILKEEQVKGKNFSTKIRLLPDQLELQKLEERLANAINSNPQFILYINPSKIMRVAKEDLKLAEILFERAQKKCITTEQQVNMQNVQANAQAQNQSLQQKAQADDALEDKKNQAKERQIFLQGFFDITKAGVQLPAELQTTMQGLIMNMALPLAMENQQMQSAIQQSQQPEQQPEMQQQPQEQQAA